MLTPQDFYEAFYRSNEKCGTSYLPLTELMVGDSMQMAAKVAHELYAKDKLQQIETEVEQSDES